MAPELELAPPPAHAPDEVACRSIHRPRPKEPAVPVYRCMLSGGPDRFRLTRTNAAGLAIASLTVISWISRLAGHDVSPATVISQAVLASAVPFSLATLVARWAGRTSGLWSGAFVVLGETILARLFPVEALVAAHGAVVAILAFALGELPKRESQKTSRLAMWSFFFGASLACAFAGPAAMAPIAVICLGTVLGTQNSRSLRFFALPGGWALLGAGVGLGMLTGAWAEPGLAFAQGEVFPDWLRLVGAAFLVAGGIVAIVSLRSGHGASSFGQLLISWVLGPALLATLGWMSAAMAAAILMPVWAGIAGIGTVDLGRGVRRGRLGGRFSRRWLVRERT